MRALLTATAMLLVAMPAVAQPKKLQQVGMSATRLHVVDTVNQSPATTSASLDVGATRWTFDVLTMRHRVGFATVKRTPYGQFASRDECEIARAKKVAELDRNDLRQPHSVPTGSRTTTTDESADAASINQTGSVSANTNMAGASAGKTSTTYEKPSTTDERKDVNDCRVS
jgi:hypothetical protein